MVQQRMVQLGAVFLIGLAIGDIGGAPRVKQARKDAAAEKSRANQAGSDVSRSGE